MNRQYSIVNKQLITPTTLLVTLKNDDPKRPVAFQPGQYMSISFKRFGRFMPSRCFSIVSDPTDQDYLQFAMRVKGAFTTASLQAKIGDPAELYGPFGGFVYNVSRDRNTVFLAGGIGITPFISMIRYASRLRTQNSIHLLYACRNQEEAAFAEELLAFEKVNPLFKVTFVLGSGPTDKLEGHGIVSKIDVPMLANACHNQFLHTSFFICGPPGFMEEMTGTLRAQLVPEDSIITEAFSQGNHKQHGFWKGWPAQVYGITGMSFLFATFIISARDVIKTQPTNANITPSNTQLTADTASSRENDINQQLNALQTGSTGPTAANATTNSSSSTTTTPASAPTQTTSTAPTTTTTSPSKTTTTPTTTTPTTTTAPAPTAVSLNFSASSTSIVSGNSVTLSWSINANATTPVTCTASGGSGWSGSKNPSGSQMLSPSSTTTYTLSCNNSANKASTKSITVTVTQPCVSTKSAPC